MAPNQLKVAVLIRGEPGSQFDPSQYTMGWWSYPVPEFTWAAFTIHRGIAVDLASLARYDLVFQVDSGDYVTYRHRGARPVVFVTWDDTLSSDHRAARLEQAKQVDMLLVDHSPLEGWPGPYKVRRANYCTDDRLFAPEVKAVDVAWHCSVKGCAERNEIKHTLEYVCTRGGWSLSHGGLPAREYARALARARVVPNFPKTPTNRPNRVMDAMAARACLLTGVLPIVDGTGMVPGEHYVTFNRPQDLEAGLHQVLDAGEWERVADAGYQLVMAKHTWAVRAAEFRQMLAEEFGL